jgi:hypothetical protein
MKQAQALPAQAQPAEGVSTEQVMAALQDLADTGN